MQREPKPSALAWLAEARIDLLWIERTDPHPDLHRRLCYAAQQAAEKALKAVLAYHGQQPDKTHHLGSLIERAARHEEIPDDVRPAFLLTEYASTTRYPDDHYELTNVETSEAVALARVVVEWAAAIIERAP